MYKVAFLSLDDIHHVYHIVPIAFELSKHSHYQCDIYTQQGGLNIIQDLIALYPEQKCRIQVLSPSVFRRFILNIRKKKWSAARIIKRYMQLWLNYDAIVTPDENLDTFIKKNKRKAKRPITVRCYHGEGDRAYGYQENEKNYDLLLLSGEKRKNRFAENNFLTQDNWAISGYVKFDATLRQQPKKLFVNDKPVILYSPHAKLGLSSWHRWGLDILDFFYKSDGYNFIFAPHINLFAKKIKRTSIPKRFFSASHMLIDFGSLSSVDMTYTKAANLYIGDVSSQVYEFLYNPRPCIFLNAHNIKWQDDVNYAFWHLGTVIDKLDQLEATIKSCLAHNAYADKQKKVFAEAYSADEIAAPVRAAKAISEFMNKNI